MELYLNNYKGFVDTLIPINDVSFFVGENSTGKTSILKLLEVLSQPHFWLNPSFNNSEIELGYFSEIVNQLSEKKDSFSIGVYFDEEKEDCAYCSYSWMSFTDKESTPALAGFKFIQGVNSVWCDSIKENVISFRTKKIDENVSFGDWVRDFEGYDESDEIKIKHAGNLPFGFIRSIIDDKLGGNSHENYENVKFKYMSPRIYDKFYWIAPIRAKAKRWYESYKLDYSSEGEHIPVLLKKIFAKNTVKNNKIIEALEVFGKNSGLFDKLEVKDGGTNDSPFSLRAQYGKLSVNITNVGYGVSQILPPIVELLTSNSNSFAIQQPEVHLHPKAQAAFGEFLHAIATKQKNRIIVETHSDYMINRFRYAMSKSKSKLSAQVVLFERDEKGTHVKLIPINNKGQFEGEAIEDYMKFFYDEEMKMLDM